MDKRIEVALALVNSGDCWLVSRRSTGRVFAGYWEFPGGKIAVGESPTEAAVRETWEETGLAVEPVGLLGEVATDHAGQTVVLHLVRCRPVPSRAEPPSPKPGTSAPGPEMPQARPAAHAEDAAVLEVRWVSSTRLRQLRMPPANAQIIERLLAGPEAGALHGPV